MFVKTKVGDFQLLENVRNAFNQEMFETRYVDVSFSKYTYLVGDISSDVLRIKGFSNDPKSQNSYKM